MVRTGVPEVLKGVSAAVLQEYAVQCIREFNASPTFAAALGVSVAHVSHCTETALRGPEADKLPSERRLGLIYTHDCRHIGCTDTGCVLCSHSQQRRCNRSFAAKYLSGDSLRATCGAPIRISLVDLETNVPASLESAGLPPNAYIRLAIVDTKRLETSMTAQTRLSPTVLKSCLLLRNNAGGPLLAERSGTCDAEGFVRVALSSRGGAEWCAESSGSLGREGMSAALPELSVTGSSEALLLSQRATFKLAAWIALEGRCEDGSLGEQDSPGTGESGPPSRLPTISPALSDAFVVATQRVRSASKKDIPHASDPVGKLHGVGAKTQSKLRDLEAAAVAAGLARGAWQPPLAAVHRVREFCALITWAEEDPDRAECTRRVLKLTRGWEEARAHALRAVEGDNALRLWSDGRWGALFDARGAVPALERAVALAHRGTQGWECCVLGEGDEPCGKIEEETNDAEAGQQGGDGAEAGPEPSFESLVARRGPQFALRVSGLASRASAAWFQRGHPGWSRLSMELADLLMLTSQQRSSHLRAEAAARVMEGAVDNAVDGALKSMPSPVASFGASPVAGASLARPAGGGWLDAGQPAPWAAQPRRAESEGGPAGDSRAAHHLQLPARGGPPLSETPPGSFRGLRGAPDAGGGLSSERKRWQGKEEIVEAELPPAKRLASGGDEGCQHRETPGSTSPQGQQDSGKQALWPAPSSLHRASMGSHAFGALRIHLPPPEPSPATALDPIFPSSMLARIRTLGEAAAEQMRAIASEEGARLTARPAISPRELGGCEDVGEATASHASPVASSSAPVSVPLERSLTALEQFLAEMAGIGTGCDGFFDAEEEAKENVHPVEGSPLPACPSHPRSISSSDTRHSKLALGEQEALLAVDKASPMQSVTHARHGLDTHAMSPQEGGVFALPGTFDLDSPRVAEGVPPPELAKLSSLSGLDLERRLFSLGGEGKEKKLEWRHLASLDAEEWAKLTSSLPELAPAE